MNKKTQEINVRFWRNLFETELNEEEAEIWTEIMEIIQESLLFLEGKSTTIPKTTQLITTILIGKSHPYVFLYDPELYSIMFYAFFKAKNLNLEDKGKKSFKFAYFLWKENNNEEIELFEAFLGMI